VATAIYEDVIARTSVPSAILTDLGGEFTAEIMDRLYARLWITRLRTTGYHPTRPITNLCTFSKMLEKLSLSRLQSHINASGKFCLYQSAYRPGYSTETALLKVVNNISCAAGSGKCTALLALDISAAFDAVNHHVLCRRLKIDFGISGTANHWLRSFVSGQSQYVTVCGEFTNPSTCLSGVPQGSVFCVCFPCW